MACLYAVCAHMVLNQISVLKKHMFLIPFCEYIKHTHAIDLRVKCS